MASLSFEELLEQLKSQDAIDRERSATKLGRYARQAAIPALIQALTDQDPNVVESAAYALSRVGARLRQAARGTASIRPLLIETTQALIAALETHPFYSVRAEAAEGLGRLKCQASKAIPALAAAMKDKEALVRASAAGVLGKFRARAQGAVTVLIEGLRDPNELVRCCSAEALGRIKCKSPEVYTALDRAARHDQNRTVRAEAIAALEELNRC